MTRRFIFLLVALIAFNAAAATSHAADIKEALQYTFKNEGGFQKDPDDSGNYTPAGDLVGTKYGIAANSYPHVDIPNLTLDGAAQIYKTDFWGASRCDDWKSQIVANNYFDVAVNQGQGTAARNLQRAINYAGLPRKPIAVDGKIGPATVQRLNEVDQVSLYVHFIGLTHNRYVQIVDANPKKEKYLREWADRIRRNVQRSVHEYEASRRPK